MQDFVSETNSSKMGGKDLIWVCWQEPATDSGKTSQIPYSWVAEVMIGDGRAPGSVIRCRWPKTRNLYSAKVIAPPSDHAERSKMSYFQYQTSSDYDNFSSPDVHRAHSPVSDTDLRGRSPHSSDPSVVAASNLVGTKDYNNMGQNRGTKNYFFPNPRQSESARRQFFNDEDDESSDRDRQRPPVLTRETIATSSSSDFSSPTVNSGNSSASPFLPKEIQKWFVLQLNNLKGELLNNFDQINHRISALDLSVRGIRDRVDRVENKIDFALLANSTSASSAAEEEGNNFSNLPERPPPLERQRTPANRSAARRRSSGPPKSKPQQSARKSIVHRVATEPDQKEEKPEPITPKNPKRKSTTISDTKSSKNEEKINAVYKPGTDESIILMGGENSIYEMPTSLYRETLYNVYESTPVYMILSLLRRTLADQEFSRLWFKPDVNPPRDDMFKLKESFAEALKRQARMQYPNTILKESEYITKMTQGTYDAKHRLKRASASKVRRQSYFDLEQIAEPAPIIAENGNGSTPKSGKKSAESRPRTVSTKRKNSTVENPKMVEKEENGEKTHKNGTPSSKRSRQDLDEKYSSDTSDSSDSDQTGSDAKSDSSESGDEEDATKKSTGKDGKSEKFIEYMSTGMNVEQHGNTASAIVSEYVRNYEERMENQESDEGGSSVSNAIAMLADLATSN